MTLKDIALVGAAYVGLIGLATLGIERIDQYYIYKSLGSYTEMWPGPGHSGATLVDRDGDGTLDRKYISFASIHGYASRDLPITARDQEVFSEIMSQR